MKTSNQETNLQDGLAAYVQLQAFLSQADLDDNERLPPERALCEILGVTRGELRKALALAEKDGQIWRHVGKGTFVGQRPDLATSVPSDHLADIAKITTPIAVMRSRLLFEPQLCKEAARNATKADLEEFALCLSHCEAAPSWRHYETWDNRFHRAIAQATHNELLVALFDMLNAVRRAVVWGRLRADPTGPGPRHHSHAEHREIAEAIAHRDTTEAAAAMRRHLSTVAARMGEE